MIHKKTSLIRFLIGVIWTLICVIRVAEGANWRAFRKDVLRGGYAREQATPPLTYQWYFRTGNAVVSSPAVVDGKVYVGDRNGKVYCFDAYSGEKIWEYQTGGWVDSSPCIYSGKEQNSAGTGTVYVGSRDGKLYAFETSTSVVKWTYSAGGMICSSPIAYDGYIYFAVGYPEKKIICLTTDGQFKWSFNTGQYAYSSPAVSQGKVYVGANDGKFYCLDAYSGAEKWSYKTDGLVYFAVMTVTEDTVYALPGEGDLTVYAFNSETGAIKWTKNLKDLGISGFSGVSSIVHSEGKLYLAAGMRPQYVFALDAATGNPLWSAPVSVGNASLSGICSSPVLANNVLYIGSAEEGDLYALDTSSGTIIWWEDLGSEVIGSPAISNGWIYVGTTEGIIYAYKASEIVSISSPDDEGIVSPVDSQVSISGYIVNSSSSNKYEIACGLGENPQTWQTISAGTVQQNEGGILGIWNTSGLALGNYTLKLTVNNSLKSQVNFFLGKSYSETFLDSYVWPNPVFPGRNETAKIKVKIPGGGKIDVEIRIYNIAGELVRIMNDFADNGQKMYQIDPGYEYDFGWNLKNDSGRIVASGVYVYIVYLNGKPEKGKIKKIAVIK